MNPSLSACLCILLGCPILWAEHSTEEWGATLGKKYEALGSFRAIYTAVSPAAEEPLHGFILEDRDSGACLVKMRSDSGEGGTIWWMPDKEGKAGGTFAIFGKDAFKVQGLAELTRRHNDLIFPGGDDSALFAGDPWTDADQDGRSAFFEYATGGSDAQPVEDPVIALGLTTFNDGGAGLRTHLEISYQRNLAADEALFRVEISPDLQNWNSLDAHLVSIENHRDGTSTYTYRSEFPVGARPREFLRLHVTRR